MIKSKIMKIILSTSFTTALLVGAGGGSVALASNIDYNNTYDISHITRYNMLKYLDSKTMHNLKCLNSMHLH